MPLPLHLFIHLVVALLVGYLVGRAFKQVEAGLLGGLLGGFFIDLDHVLEYFLIFGRGFNIFSFFEGRHFLASEKIYILFHAWEYVPFLFLLAWLLRKKKQWAVLMAALAMGMFIHLISDCLINNYPPRNYSLTYRYQVNFEAKELLNAEQYQKFIENKRYFGS